MRADVNEVLQMEAILSTIERASIQMCTNFRIFEYCTAEEFKNACMNTLKMVKLALIHPVTRVNDPNEQLKLIKEYHSDHIRGGHCGQNDLTQDYKINFIGVL